MLVSKRTRIISATMRVVELGDTASLHMGELEEVFHLYRQSNYSNKNEIEATPKYLPK